MANKGYVESLLNQLDAKTKKVLTQVFTHVLDTFQIGGAQHQEKALNLRWYRVDFTTSSTANEEVSVQHGLGVTPYLAIPMLPLDSSGVKHVRLEVTRPADANRIYVRSPETSAPVTVFLEV